MTFLRTHPAWPAPAKLNLFLHITGRRDDGYHELQTVFQLLDYGDELDFVPRQDGQVILQGGLPDVPMEQDLIVRAAQCLKQTFHATQAGQREKITQIETLGADIYLTKRIPAGGGLGGGSSDAATTLVALNAIWNLGFSLENLAQMGKILGADVPVFVQGQSAWAEGIGEILSPISLKERCFIVLTPNVHCNTGMIFGTPTLTRNTPKQTMRAFNGQANLNNLMAQWQNNCLPVVLEKFPEVQQAFDFLRQNCNNAFLTGTGSSVFAEVDTYAKAQAILGKKPKNTQAFVAFGTQTSGLMARLNYYKNFLC